MIVRIHGLCQWPDCTAEATSIAFARRTEKKPKLYCDKHAAIAADEGGPEYEVNCPNCDCQFGVN